MEIRELRVRYELPTASGRTVIHAVVCRFQTLMCHIKGIKEAGYKVVGIDERYRQENVWMELDEGWTEIEPMKKEEK